MIKFQQDQLYSDIGKLLKCGGTVLHIVKASNE